MARLNMFRWMRIILFLQNIIENLNNIGVDEGATILNEKLYEVVNLIPLTGKKIFFEEAVSTLLAVVLLELWEHVYVALEMDKPQAL